METYVSAQYPFAVQYPAEWSLEPSDETVTAQYGGNNAGLAIAEEDLEAQGMGETTLQEYADLVVWVLSMSLEDFELISRHEGVNAQGLPVQVLAFSAGPGGMLRGSRLVYVHEDRVAFSATYFALREGYGELESLIAYSFSTFEVREATAATPDTAIARSLDCEGVGEEFVAYGDDELGIGFCHPSGWVVDDTVQIGGFLAVSPDGYGLGDSMPECLVLIYPHETVAQLSQPNSEAEDILGLGLDFFVMIVQDASSDESPTTASIGDQNIATVQARGTTEGQAVLGLITGIKRGEATAMAISFVLDEDAYRTLAEGIMGSFVVTLPELAVVGEARPIGLNEFQDGVWTADRPGRHSLHIEASTPVLFVSQLLAQGGLDDKADLQVYDPQSVFVDQFTTGWMHAQSAFQDPDGCWVHHYAFGHLEPDALRLVLDRVGEYTVTVGGSTFWHDEGMYRLRVLDMRPGSPAVLDIAQAGLDAGEAAEYVVDGTANRPTMAYLRPSGSQAQELTLSLELLDDTGERVEEKHNHMHSGDDVFLFWVPRNNVPYTIRVAEVDGQPAQYELTLLAAPRPEEPEPTSLSCDEYNVDIEVQETGDLLVDEQHTLVFAEEMTYESHRTLHLTNTDGIAQIEVSEGEQQYAQSESGEVGTYAIVEEEDALVIRWFTAGTPRSSRAFTLRYVVRGAVQQDEEGRDVVVWKAMPPERDYRIRQGQVLVHLPAEVRVHEFIAFGAQGEGTAKSKSYDPVITNEVAFVLSHDLMPERGMEVRVVYDLER
jgi:hypothetical protein